MSESSFKYQKADLLAVCCECGAEIALVPDLAEMGRRIEDHAIEHKNREVDPSKADAVFNRVQDLLTMKVLQRISQSN